MNYKFGIYLFIIGFALFASCSKENIDDSILEEDEVIAEMVTCNLSLHISDEGAGVLVARASDGTEPYLYLWSTGQSSNTINVSESGDYSVEIIDGEGCIITETISVTIENNGCNGLSLSLVGDLAIGSSISAEVTGGTPPYAYVWSTGEQTQTITPTLNGEIEVTVIDAVGCTITNIITVFGESDDCNNLNLTTLSDVTVGSILTVEVTGGTPPYNYQWSNGESTPSITTMQEGELEIIVTDAVGCTVSQIVFVSESNDDCNNLSLILDGQFTVGSSITANVSGGTAPYNYQWSNGVVDQSMTPSEAGDYEVIIVDTVGCTVTEKFVITD